MSIHVCETGGSGRDSLLIPLMSCESWMLVKENSDIKKKERDLSKISKSRNSLRYYTQQENTTNFHVNNMQHIGSLTEIWIEIASVLGNTKILFETHPGVRANELVNYFTQ